jgi:hypothetical protein
VNNAIGTISIFEAGAGMLAGCAVHVAALPLPQTSQFVSDSALLFADSGSQLKV